MYLILALLEGKYLHRVEKNDSKPVTIGSGKHDTLQITELGKAQLKLQIKNGQMRIAAHKISDISATGIEAGYILQKVSKEKNISLCWHEEDVLPDQIVKLPYRGILRLGRKKENDIIIPDPVISGMHLIIKCEDGKVTIEDGYNGRPSSNGTFVNTRSIKKCVLNPNDTIDLMHIRIT